MSIHDRRTGPLARKTGAHCQNGERLRSDLQGLEPEANSWEGEDRDHRRAMSIRAHARQKGVCTTLLRTATSDGPATHTENLNREPPPRSVEVSLKN